MSDETRAAPSANERGLRLRAATLHYRDGGENKSITVARRALVGSSPDVDVRVGDPLVSRLHCELEILPDGLWIRDLGSKNGTYLNDLRIQSARAPTRATLRIGTTEIAIRSDEKQDVAVWPTASFGRLIGASVPMRALYATLDRVAASEAAVLIKGETGTGKELVAEAIHSASRRREHPFVTVDCAALPETLLESELFGHARGAFTGASSARIGAFESAASGTIFLDEIGELPLAMQPKLLRVLENKTVRRLGETAHRSVDVRVITATHRDLVGMVARGEFREDLYFRLGVVPVSVPPLRERREDIPALISHFLSQTHPDAKFGDEVVRALSSRSFRGNVRELRNLVDRIAALGPAVLDDDSDMLAESASSPAAAPSTSEPTVDQDYRSFRDAWIEEGERRYALALLERHDGNVSAAARAAGITRNYLHRLLRRARP